MEMHKKELIKVITEKKEKEIERDRENNIENGVPKTH